MVDFTIAWSDSAKWQSNEDFFHCFKSVLGTAAGHTLPIWVTSLNWTLNGGQTWS